MASDPKLATTFAPPPGVPASSVPLTDEDWRDYQIRLQRYVASLAVYAAQIATVAAAAQPAPTDQNTGN